MIAVGAVLALIGFWIVMRTIVKDSTGRTLVDRLTGAGATA